MKINIPIEVEFDNIQNIIDDLKQLQTYKLSEGDEMMLVDIDDVIDILVEHIKAKESEHKTGRWIVMKTVYEDTVAKCSECRFETLVNEPGNGLHMIEELNYCPNCGSYNGGRA